MVPGVRVIEVDGVDPLRDPDDYPIQVQGPAHPPITTLTVVGDIMLGREVTGHPALRPMAQRLASADITVGNLESTLSDAGPPNPVQGDRFHAPPAVRGQLRAAGFDVLGLANNHTGDFGGAALEDTVRLLRAGGFATFGAGRDLAQASRPVVLTRHGIRFGFLGFNAIGETPEAAPGQPGALSVSMPPRTGPLDTAELDRVLADVRRLARRVDVVTVVPHWGTQYTHRPEPIQGRVARALVGAGADLVVGGHPHWVQGAVDDRRRPAGELARQLRLRHGHAGDQRGRDAGGDLLGRPAGGGRLRALPDRDRPRAAGGARGRGRRAVLDPFWEFSGLGASS